jgi:ATP-dependent Clp protease ATP-binding subunit ClpA
VSDERDRDSQMTSFGRYSGEAMRVLFEARRQLGRFGGTHVTPEHILLAMLTPEAGAAFKRLHTVGLPIEDTRARMENGVRSEARHVQPEDAQLADATHVLLDRALAATAGKVGSDDLLFALCDAPGLAGDALRPYFFPTK